MGRPAKRSGSASSITTWFFVTNLRPRENIWSSFVSAETRRPCSTYGAHASSRFSRSTSLVPADRSGVAFACFRKTSRITRFVEHGRRQRLSAVDSSSDQRLLLYSWCYSRLSGPSAKRGQFSNISYPAIITHFTEQRVAEIIFLLQNFAFQGMCTSAGWVS